MAKAKPEVFKRIYEAICKGATYKIACSYGGITFETFNEWRKEKPEFSDLVEKAEAEAALRWLDKIEAASDNPNHWTAAAWKLERRFPDDYARRERVEGSVDLNLKVVIEHRDRPQLPEPLPGVIIESQ